MTTLMEQIEENRRKKAMASTEQPNSLMARIEENRRLKEISVPAAPETSGSFIPELEQDIFDIYQKALPYTPLGPVKKVAEAIPEEVYDFGRESLAEGVKGGLEYNPVTGGIILGSKAAKYVPELPPSVGDRIPASTQVWEAGRSALAVPQQAEAAALGGILGMEGASQVKESPALETIRAAREASESRLESMPPEYKAKPIIPGFIDVGDVAELPANIGFSAASMGASALGSPAGPGGTMLAGGVAAWRMAAFDKAMQELAAENDRRAQSGLPKMNEAEEQEFVTSITPQLQEYAAWEAIPEAVGNVATMGAGKLAVKGGTSLLTKGLGVLGEQAVEHGTETVTGVGQSRAGLSTEQPLDWSMSGLWEAFKQQAPQTLMMGFALGGTAGGAHALSANQQLKEAGSTLPPDIKNEIIETGVVSPEVEAAVPGLTEKVEAVKGVAKGTPVPVLPENLEEIMPGRPEAQGSQEQGQIPLLPETMLDYAPGGLEVPQAKSVKSDIETESPIGIDDMPPPDYVRENVSETMLPSDIRQSGPPVLFPERETWMGQLPEIEQQKANLPRPNLPNLPIFQDVKGTELNEDDINTYPDDYGQLGKDVAVKADRKTPYLNNLRDWLESEPEMQGEPLNAVPPMSPEQAQGLNIEMPAPSRWENFKQKVSDEFGPMIRYIDAIKEAGGEVSAEENPDIRRQTNLGIARNMVKEVRTKYLEPITEMFKKYKIDLDQFNEYLVARHAKERNAHIAEINPKEPRFMENDVADIILLNAPKEFGQVADLVDSLNREGVDILVRFGLLSKEEAAAWNQYEHYVPLVAKLDSNGMPVYKGGGTLRSKESKRALGGSGYEIVGPLEMSFAKLEDRIKRALDNDFRRSIYDLAMKYPSPLFTIDKIKTHLTFDAEDGVKQVPSVDKGPGTIAVKIDGQLHYIKINDPQLASAFASIDDTSKLPAAIQAIRATSELAMPATSYLSKVYVNFSPEFSIRNGIRDMTFGLMAAMIEHGPIAAIQIGSNIIPAQAGMAARRLGKGGKWSGYADRYIRAGGQTSYLNRLTPDDIAIDIRKAVSPKPGSKVIDTVKMPLKIIEGVNTIVENGTRLAYFGWLVEHGYSDREAAFMAKEFTVNFDRKGAWLKHTNGVWMFSTAGVGGTRRMGQIIVKYPVKSSIAISSLAGLGVALGVFNRMHDPDGWDELPSYLKDSNFVISAKGFEAFAERAFDKEHLFKDDLGGTWITIPAPHGFRFFLGLGYNIEDAGANGPESANRVAERTVSLAVNSFSPIGGQYSRKGTLETVYKSLLPSALQPLDALKSNENWTGRQIAPESNFDLDTYDHEKYYDDISPMARFITDKLFEYTGGSYQESKQDAPFWVADVSPESLEYAFESATAAPGQLIKRLTNIADTKIKHPEEPLKTKDIPVKRIFINKQSDYEK